MSKIQSIKAYEILASDGFPTVKCVVNTDDGFSGAAAVSYGLSAGSHEATVLNDGDKKRYFGHGVLNVCKTIEEELAPNIIGLDVFDQEKIDKVMIELDGTERKEKLGGNALLAVSMATARAGACASNLELYEYLEKTFDTKRGTELPKPMVVTIEGGKHADNSTDLQEYLLTITHSNLAKENVRVASEIYHSAKEILKEKGYAVNVGNEGAFAPEGITSNRLPLDILLLAISRAGYKPEIDAWISIDSAASEFFKEEKYNFACEKKVLTPEELLNWYRDIIEKYPIYSVEDMFAEDSWSYWTKAMQSLGDKIKIVGDDLTVTNVTRLQKAVDEKAINAILIKLNQAGTVSETIGACKLAKQNGFLVIPSHRGGGESNDTFLVDLAVAVGADFVKVGITRGERVAKYNRLMAIENQL